MAATTRQQPTRSAVRSQIGSAARWLDRHTSADRSARPGAGDLARHLDRPAHLRGTGR